MNDGSAVRPAELPFAYSDAGSGSPIVLVHGSVDDMRTWSYQIAPFSERHRVIAYSRRHHWPNGLDARSTAYRATEHRDDLADVIRAFGAAPAHIVGASYGGVIALLLAATQPALVRSLVLGEPPAFNFLDSATREAQRQETIVPALRAYDAGEPEKGIESFLNAVVGPGAFSTFPPQARAAAYDNAAEFGLQVHTTPTEYFGPLAVADLAGIDAPALLVQGDRSPKIFGRVIDVLRAELPNARQIVVPGASHAMHRHNASFYNAAVLEFLSSIDSGD